MPVPTQEQPVAVDIDVDAALAKVGEGIGELQSVDWSQQPVEAQLEAVRALEVLARRHDALTHQLIGAVDRSGAHALDGHRTAKAAVKFIGRCRGPRPIVGLVPLGPCTS